MHSVTHHVMEKERVIEQSHAYGMEQKNQLAMHAINNLDRLL